jgi:trehalose-6-phosphatase
VAPTVSLPQPAEFPTTGAFLFWLDTARGGSAFAYHYGNLAADRGPEEARIPEVNKRAEMAWDAYERGQVVLVRQRLGEKGQNYFAYLALMK